MARIMPAGNGTNLLCGHRIDLRFIPKSNCEICWKVYFMVHKLDAEPDVFAMSHGMEDEIRKKKGSKYVKQLKRLSTFIQEYVEKEKNNEQFGETD